MFFVYHILNGNERKSEIMAKFTETMLPFTSLSSQQLIKYNSFNLILDYISSSIFLFWSHSGFEEMATH